LLTFQTLKEAERITGKLSKPSKMPGYAYGIPARSCPVGQLLVKIKGSVCSNCYALKGRYVFPNVKAAQEYRLKTLRDPFWVDAMVYIIKKRKIDYFRWHDSGDLQGDWHLKNIIDVALACPETKFWLPTREKAVVLRCPIPIPPNLVIRISGTMIDGAPPSYHPAIRHVSTVVTDKSKASCPAHRQGGKCGSCRNCWDPGIYNVSYPRH
jgi:hypothetical protein